MAGHVDLVNLDHLEMMAQRVKTELDKKADKSATGEVPEGYDSITDYIDDVKKIAEEASEWKPISG